MDVPDLLKSACEIIDTIIRLSGIPGRRTSGSKESLSPTDILIVIRDTYGLELQIPSIKKILKKYGDTGSAERARFAYAIAVIRLLDPSIQEPIGIYHMYEWFKEDL